MGYQGDCATITGLAKGVCAQYDRGLDWESVLEQVDGATKDESLSNYVMAGAPLYFCPGHADKSP